MEEGIRTSNKYDNIMTLTWEWHGKVYLGVAHGIVGILHKLLNFIPELEQLSKQNNDYNNNKNNNDDDDSSRKFNYIQMIQDTIHELNDKICFVSSKNLPSSYNPHRTINNEKNHDKLVQWCHGGTGYVLLLIKAYDVFDNEIYLKKARIIAEKVIWPRGLLKKGVGLFHGIGGNVYAFLAVYRGLKLINERKKQPQNIDDYDDVDDRTKKKSKFMDNDEKKSENKRKQTSGKITEKEQNDDDVDDQVADQCLQMAHFFASFACENLSQLEDVPDRPYSLYEGLAGLVMLMIDLESPDYSNFPIFI